LKKLRLLINGNKTVLYEQLRVTISKPIRSAMHRDEGKLRDRKVNRNEEDDENYEDINRDSDNEEDNKNSSSDTVAMERRIIITRFPLSFKDIDSLQILLIMGNKIFENKWKNSRRFV